MAHYDATTGWTQQMSVRVLSNVFKHSESKLGARLVLLVLADAAHDDGITWVDYPGIARKARMSESQSRAAVKKLEEAGELQVLKARRGRSTINVYRVLAADDAPDLKRLPTEIAELFSAADSPADIQRVNDRSPADSPADFVASPPSTRNRVPVQAGASAPSEAGASGEVHQDVPPAIVLQDGKNVALDVLAEVCGINQRSPQMKQVVAALNGPRNEVGIRHLFWHELYEWADHHDAMERLATLYDDPQRFADLLCEGIRKKAALYRSTMNGAMLTPTALRKWWLDIEGRPGSGNLTGDQIRRGT